MAFGIVRDRVRVVGDLHPLALNGVVMSFGAPRSRAHFITTVPGEALWVLFSILFGVYRPKVVLVVVGPEASFVVYL